MPRIANKYVLEAGKNLLKLERKTTAIVTGSPEHDLSCENDSLPPLRLEQQWLDIQCNLLSGISRGFLFRISSSPDRASLEASWPELLCLDDDFIDKVLLTASRKKIQLETLHKETADPTTIRTYYPLSLSGGPNLHFVVILEMTRRDKEERRAIAKLLRWNAEFLKLKVA